MHAYSTPSVIANVSKGLNEALQLIFMEKACPIEQPSLATLYRYWHGIFIIIVSQEIFLFYGVVVHFTVHVYNC